MEDLLLGVVSHATGVEEDGICLVDIFRRLIPRHLHH